VAIGQGRLEKILEENFRFAPAAAFFIVFPDLLWPCRDPKNLRFFSCCIRAECSIPERP